MLQLCPFCGGVAKLKKSMFIRCKYVTCVECGAIGPKFENEEYAIEWWNNRISAEKMLESRKKQNKTHNFLQHNNVIYMRKKNVL